MSDLVGNPEDRFSHNEAHLGSKQQRFLSGCAVVQADLLLCCLHMTKNVLSHGVANKQSTFQNHLIFLLIYKHMLFLAEPFTFSHSLHIFRYI